MKFKLGGYGWYVADGSGIRLQPAPPPPSLNDADKWRKLSLHVLRRELDNFGFSPAGQVRDASGLQAAATRQPRLLREDGDPLPTGLPAPELISGDLPLTHDQADGQPLATFYAELWTLLRQAGVEVPDEEHAEAADELDGTGWTVARDGQEYRAEPAGDSHGLMLG